MLTAIILTIIILKHLPTVWDEIVFSKVMLEWLSGKK